jgi:hypothetical protein
MLSSFFSKKRMSRPTTAIVAVVCIAVLVVALALVVGGCGSKAGLVGKWYSASEAETVEFAADGKMTVTDDAGGVTNLDYVAADSKLTLSAGGQSVEVTYTIDGDTLSVSDPDTQEPVAYERVK